MSAEYASLVILYVPDWSGWPHTPLGITLGIMLERAPSPQRLPCSGGL